MTRKIYAVQDRLPDRYLLDLLARIVTVTLRTMRLVDDPPDFDIRPAGWCAATRHASSRPSVPLSRPTGGR